VSDEVSPQTRHNQAILIIEDDKDSRDALAGILTYTGYVVKACGTGEEALVAFDKAKYSLVILDLMLPDTGGYEVLRQLRLIRDVPIIILSGLSGTKHKVHGLRLGADDYLSKPFDAEELLARVDARLRRSKDEQQLVCGPVRVDVSERQALVNDVPVALTRRQFDLLSLLMSEPGRPFTREHILERVWGTSFVSPRNVNEQVRLLRKRLKAAGLDEDIIESAPGFGYRSRSKT
jgi:two-component system alkaline phosphatase synthesis response regulator PhoP